MLGLVYSESGNSGILVVHTCAVTKEGRVNSCGFPGRFRAPGFDGYRLPLRVYGCVCVRGLQKDYSAAQNFKIHDTSL